MFFSFKKNQSIDSNKKLIVGLGNPEKKYFNTWHNLGFLVIDEIIKNYNLPSLKIKNKFQAELSEAEIDNKKIILAKPLTYMNNSGITVSGLANYFKIKTENIIIIQDDLDLTLGKIKIVQASRDGGHNGIKSIIEKLKTDNFIRIKIGIKTEKLGLINPADYVLTGWSEIEKEKVEEQIKKTTQAVINIITKDLNFAKNNLNK